MTINKTKADLVGLLIDIADFYFTGVNDMEDALEECREWRDLGMRAYRLLYDKEERIEDE